MDDIHARVPVNMLAVKTVLFSGEHFSPYKKSMQGDSQLPLPIRKITKQNRLCPDFHDLTGKNFGRWVVLGLSADTNGKWVCRCSCGKYGKRSKKSILNPENKQDMCDHCRHLVFLKKDEYYRRTGKDTDIHDFI